jgi:hypothetical protein
VRAARIASTQPSAVSRSTYDNPHVCVTASHGIDDEASTCAILSGILIDLGLAVFHRPQSVVCAISICVATPMISYRIRVCT